ncbi:hypothetical protein [Paraburkholderia caballeronis]|uniref:Uncharacterized protein n=1 Tax=Paraburkholderia caballeronis TaxID=416943 RepID=A0A1H7K2P2_9BURK|nr:hypothetical protein [Paraburkholderia caballeronis]PXW27189.1 hypothetical protein C7403_10395 [Paraburkholderia caballeronis]PXX02663.1 hypothetical protein C7407_10395 [Paraburkholderia caballeronis]RAK03388.1 hypothetical protein C7409_10395 [Paraburkholderia caballeronis]TDV11555.1 hypothetical protein C7406_12030 [Paraburkholderia caballeronis]TDV17438.1 hypothetical protein C7408_10492 [Paraburkholderia caballeronis]
MYTEVLGHYQVELSARQIIDHGGWAAFATIHEVPDEDACDAHRAIFPTQQVVDETVFESEEAAIAGARRVALAFLRSGNLHA